MALPEPHPGLVISYRYLWSEEHRRGRKEGAKNRPCAIVLARRIARGRMVVTVVPVSHARPSDPQEAVEIPASLKAHLGLDDARSWVVLTEVNEFLWPGPDLSPVSRKRPRDFAYGVLPPAFFNRLRDRLLEIASARRISSVDRDQ